MYSTSREESTQGGGAGGGAAGYTYSTVLPVRTTVPRTIRRTSGSDRQGLIKYLVPMHTRSCDRPASDTFFGHQIKDSPTKIVQTSIIMTCSLPNKAYRIPVQVLLVQHCRVKGRFKIRITILGYTLSVFQVGFLQTKHGAATRYSEASSTFGPNTMHDNKSSTTKRRRTHVLYSLARSFCRVVANFKLHSHAPPSSRCRAPRTTYCIKNTERIEFSVQAGVLFLRKTRKQESNKTHSLGNNSTRTSFPRLLKPSNTRSLTEADFDHSCQ